jgi:hypothetical protein
MAKMGRIPLRPGIPKRARERHKVYQKWAEAEMIVSAPLGWAVAVGRGGGCWSLIVARSGGDVARPSRGKTLARDIDRNHTEAEIREMVRGLLEDLKP